MGNIDAYFSAHEAAYERRYGGISLGTPIGISQEADDRRKLRNRHKTGEHETHVCEDCGGEFEELVDAAYHKRRCVKCRRGNQ